MSSGDTPVTHIRHEQYILIKLRFYGWYIYCIHKCLIQTNNWKLQKLLQNYCLSLYSIQYRSDEHFLYATNFASEVTYKYKRVPAILVGPLLLLWIFTAPHLKIILCFMGHMLIFDFLRAKQSALMSFVRQLPKFNFIYFTHKKKKIMSSI
jgi:hypothetical protein